ncbi:MAG TPA: type II toxin-antitoxin system Phd/YefM family antitoxin [Anaerolineae bacterium]|nr:type II toxin-antitoxin system Phd/YefM family antitoxin [Anaerolineae bacterium]
MTTTKSISSTEAQNKFGQVLNDVTQHQTRYIIERRNNPQAIILSFDDFSRILNDELERQTINEMLKEVRPTYALGRVIDYDSTKDDD